MAKSATWTVQQWGNSLAVRIPAAVARSARCRVGQPVEVSAQDSNILIKALGEPKLTLAQKLAGREMKDNHPLVVLSPREFNARTGLVIGLPMTTAAYDESNPFAVKFIGTKGVASHILGHQPQSFDWRARNAKPHPLRKVAEESYARASETFNQIIEIGTSRGRGESMMPGQPRTLARSLASHK